MEFMFDKNYFFNSMPFIHDNEKIRNPQYEAYYKVIEYFNGDYPNRNALIVLPTGVGKTGVIALMPFRLCKKRTLVITPGTVIRDDILENINAENPRNFWYKTNVFEPGNILPNVIEYKKDVTSEILNVANIVVLNIHKLQQRFESSLLYKVPRNFFDLIIVDEAHHSAAATWTDCIDYFSNTKVVKLTGTPFRTDGVPLNAKLVYKYPLSRAMHHAYVKSLENIKYVPGEITRSFHKQLITLRATSSSSNAERTLLLTLHFFDRLET